MKRKIICFVLLVFLVATLAIPASAAASASMTVSNATPHRGDTFTVTVSLSGAGACDAGSVEIKYGSGLELTAAKSLANGISISENLAQGRVIFFALNGAVDVKGKLVSLTFKVKSNASYEAKKLEVSIQVNGQNVKASKTVTVTCNHTYSAWASDGADKHSRKCTACGKTETQAHAYDNLCDTSCNACGATRTTEHVFSDEWVGDETGHWHACVNCSEKSTLEEHVPGAPAGEYTDQVCTVCQFVLTPALGHQHRYDGAYESDNVFHWAKCLGCGEETEKLTHVYDNDCDDTCNDCGRQRGVLHKVSESWSCDGQKHWKACADCGLHLEENDHIWDGGTVTLKPSVTSKGKILYRCGLCHTERSEEIPALHFTEALPWWLWAVMGIAFGAGIVLGVQGIIALIKSFQNKGKYSG